MGEIIKLHDGLLPDVPRETYPHYYKNLNLQNIMYVNEEGILCEEQWKDVAGYEGRYMVSDCGRVKSLARLVERRRSGNYLMKDKILGQTETDRRGYVRVPFTTNSITIQKYVHILVGQHFIPNPLNKKTVNHKKGNKKDNRAWMLEWNTHGENHSHSYRELGRKHSMIGKHGYSNKQSKEVLCVTTGIKYGSVTDAANKLGLSFQNVSKVCKGKRHHTGGYVFKFTQA